MSWFGRGEGGWDWRVWKLSYGRDRRGNVRGYHGSWVWYGRHERADLSNQPPPKEWKAGPFMFRLATYSNGRAWFDVYFRHRRAV